MKTLLDLAALPLPEAGARIILAIAVMIGTVVGVFYYVSKKP
jgi:hypothetical protein